jgi:K(+)-stimulated pyrophosphate-energized sodium pump
LIKIINIVALLIVPLVVKFHTGDKAALIAPLSAPVAVTAPVAAPSASISKAGNEVLKF